MSTRVTHIARFSVQDLRTSRVRARSATTGDPLLRLVYYEILFALYEAGGELPDDPEVLSDVLMLPPEVIAERLPVLQKLGEKGRGGIIVESGRLTNRRVTEDMEADKNFRSQASQFGKLGGRPPRQVVENKPSQKGTLRVQEGDLKLSYALSSSSSSSSSSSVPLREDVSNGTVGDTKGDARGGERPPPAAPPEVVKDKKPKGAPRAPKARKAFPFAALPLELAALPWFRERWEYRINSLPSKDLPTPAGEIEQLQEALLLYRTHGEEALRKGVTKAINRGWTGFEMGWCLDRNGAVTNGYDRDAIRQEHKQAGNSPATQARLAAAVAEHERKRQEYLDSFLTEGPPNDDDD